MCLLPYHSVNDFSWVFFATLCHTWCKGIFNILFINAIMTYLCTVGSFIIWLIREPHHIHTQWQTEHVFCVWKWSGFRIIQPNLVMKLLGLLMVTVKWYVSWYIAYMIHRWFGIYSDPNLNNPFWISNWNNEKDLFWQKLGI